MKRVVAVFASMSMLAAGMGVATEEAAAEAGAKEAAEVAWGPCQAGNRASPGAPARKGSSAPSRVECTSVRVPLDYREPYGQTITLALNRVRGTVSRDHNHLGVLLVNPGGPGASGRALAKHVADTLPDGLANRFDVIGFDPRGVGDSVPALTCVDAEKLYAAPRLDHVPRTTTAERTLADRARGYATACGNRWSWMLPHLTTENSARDIDSIRRALGEERVSYLGYSYGSYLGAVYATLFPNRVKRLVLDSVVDPKGDWYASNIAQNHSFERRHRDFLAWTARHNNVYRLGRDQTKVRFAWNSMRDRLGARPAEGTVGPSELDDTFTAGGYSDTIWPQLAQAFSDYVRRGQTKGLLAAYQQHGRLGASDENGYAVYLGVQCGDSPWPRDWARWHADMAASHTRSPFMTWPNAWYNAPCAFWPRRGGTPVRVTGDRRLPPILMLQAERDAATPREGALRMRQALGSASLVVEPGGNHGVVLSGNACADRRLAAYLRDGSVPVRRPGSRPDARCPSKPAPRPNQPARTTTEPARTTTEKVIEQPESNPLLGGILSGQ
ncbi:alpha/beta hydrolase [Streptosporangium sp. KLBMP 9127]|nr:alpha/beta hydrolase [Streptosporangium sp. KLBMP 9127]